MKTDNAMAMTTEELARAVGELMATYTGHRDRWIEQYGSDTGFDDWFTGQIARQIAVCNALAAEGGAR